jgi:hypothetical protein
MGKRKGTYVTGAGGPSRLTAVVAVSVVLRVEQVWAGGWEGVAEERAGRILRGIRRRQAACSLYLTRCQFVLQLENLGVDPQTQVDQQADRENNFKGGQKTWRRMPKRRGGC